MKYTKVGASKALKRIADSNGVFRPRDLVRYGIPRTYLQRWVQDGLLERVGWGLYRLTNRALSEHQTLIEVAKRVPNGVVCLLSALQFHGLGTQLPSQVWIAIDRKAWKPEVRDLPIRIVRFSGHSLTEGVQVHRLDGVKVSVYEPAKTVADCFRYRNKIGLDVAIEALRDCRDQRRCSIDEIWRYAKIDRVANVMHPYLEALG